MQIYVDNKLVKNSPSASMNEELALAKGPHMVVTKAWDNAESADVSITAVVYIDNQLIYNDTSGATYVDTAFTVSKGGHYIVVKAFDANGKSYAEARNITAQ